MTEPQSTQDDKTVYLAVGGNAFDELLEATRDYLGSNPDPEALLQRWLSLQLAATRVAVMAGTTPDSQAQITGLLTTIESLQHVAENMGTEHITWHDMTGVEYHPDWCRECRVTVIMDGVHKALDELERHIDQPGTPADVSNVCRRVARYLTDHTKWKAPVEPETRGMREIRELISVHVKLDGVDDFPWQSTIAGVEILLGDLRAMAGTIQRRSLWLAAAEAKLVRLGEPMTNEEREEFARRDQEG